MFLLKLFTIMVVPIDATMKKPIEMTQQAGAGHFGNEKINDSAVAQQLIAANAMKATSEKIFKNLFCSIIQCICDDYYSKVTYIQKKRETRPFRAVQGICRNPHISRKSPAHASRREHVDLFLKCVFCKNRQIFEQMKFVSMLT